MTRKRHILPTLLAGLLSAALLAGASGAQAVEPAAPPTLGIYTTGDMGGRVFRQAPLTGEPVENGYQNVAAAMELQREQVDAALLLDSGDAVDNGLAQGGGAAEALALRAIGYDALSPAVGEFRLGQEARDGFFHALSSREGEGTPVSVLSANYLDAGSQSPEEDAYQVFTVTLGQTQVRVGVLGMGAMEAPEQLPESELTGIRFSHQDNPGAGYAWEWTEYWQERLEGEACDLVVVLCHTGPEELRQFAAQTTGIDLLVGGHGSAAAETLTNADGAPVRYVSGGGTALTRTTVTLSAAGTPVVGESTLLSLSDYPPDNALAKTLSKAQADTAARLLSPAGTLAGDWSEEDSPLYLQSAATDLIGAAMLWASGADGALFAPSTLGEKPLSAFFSPGEETAALTLGDCAALLPNTAPLVLVEMTGAQLRQWLEYSAGAYQVGGDGSIAGGQDADVLYGLDYTLYLGAAPGEQVDGLTLEGVPVEDGQVLRIAVSAQRLFEPDFPEYPVLWSSARDSRFSAQSGAPAAVLAAYLSCETQLLGQRYPQRDSQWALYTGSVDGPMNRLEFVTLLYEAAGKPKPGASAAFIDVSDSDAAVWAAETGVVSGNGQGKFLPTQTVTREQAAAMLYNYAKALGLKAPSSGPSISSLLDAGEIAAWARPSVEFCIRTGALPADETGRFRPADSFTRAEAADYLAAFAAYARALN